MNISGLAARNGSIYVAIDMGYNPNVAVLDLICSKLRCIQVRSRLLESKEATTVRR